MPFSPDLIAGMSGFLFTLMILSYLIGDNPLFRVAVYIFVGVSAGYVAAVAWWQVLLPDLFIPLLNGTMIQRGLLVIPLILSVLLLMKVSPRLTQLGSPAMAFLVGVSAAVAVGGAVVGTIFPQISATINAFDLSAATAHGTNPLEALMNDAFILAGTITTLAYFHFGARMAADGSIRRFGVVELTAWVGRIFLAITLGVLFAGVYAAALTAFIERLSFLAAFFGSF